MENSNQKSQVTVQGMEKIVIRKATPADKEAVLKIHDHVYDGQDYLPAYYDHFQSSADFIPYVLLFDGEIIMYEVVEVVDEGLTQVGRAGRVNPKYEGKGFMKYFGIWIADWRKKNNIRTIAFTVVDANPAIKRHSFQQRNRHVLTKQMSLYCVDVHKVTFTMDHIQSAMNLETVSEEQLSQYFKSKLVKKYLCPEGRMVVDWVPLKPIDANIPYMKGPVGYTTVFSDIRTEYGQCIGLLSFGTVFEVRKHPFQCNLDIFGNDTRTLTQHIIRRLQVMRSKVKGVVAILVLVQEDFDMAKLDSVFEKFGVKRTIWYDSTYPARKYSQLLLYERDLFTNKL